MIKDDKITQRQLMTAAFVALFSPAVRILPHRAAELGGKAVWLSPFAAFLPIFGICFLISAMLKNRLEDEGLSHIIERALGPAVGKAVVCIFGIWLAVYAGFALRSAGERLMSTIYENGSIVFIIVVTAALTLIAALGKIKSWARSGEVFLIILLIILVFTFSFALTDIKIENLLPVTYMDMGDIFIGAVPVINVVSIFVYFSFLSSHVKKSGKEKSTTIRWVVYMLIGIFFVMITTIGSLGKTLMTHMDNSFFVMIRNTTIFNIVERFEALVVGAWIMTDFVFITGLILSSSEALKNVTNAKKRNSFVWPCMAVMIAVSFLIAPNAFKFKMISDIFVPAINLFFIFIVIPIIFVIGKIRKKI